MSDVLYLFSPLEGAPVSQRENSNRADLGVNPVDF